MDRKDFEKLQKELAKARVPANLVGFGTKKEVEKNGRGHTFSRKTSEYVSKREGIC